MASNIRVRLCKDTETLEVTFQVSLLSNKMRGRWTHFNGIPADGSIGELERLMSEAASVIAIKQITDFGDAHDPVDCARCARAAMHDIRGQADRAHKKIISVGGAPTIPS